MRLFLALVPDARGREALAEAGRALRDRFPGWRWLPAEGLHLTLAFLGEQGKDALDAAAASLSRISGLAPIDALCGRVLALPSPKSSRVLALGASGPGAAAMRRVWALTNEALAAECAARGLPAINPGFKGQNGRFLPHISLARAGRAGIVFQDGPGAEHSAVSVEARARFASIVLYESFLEPEGARYEARATLALGRGD